MATFAIPTDAPRVSGPPQGQWSVADWERLDHSTRRYEIIEGVLYVTTAPSNFHQWISRRLERLIGIPAEDQGLAYCFDAPIGVLMPGCDPVQPDYVVITLPNAGIIHDRRIRGVPDLIVEILSRGNAQYDLEVKLAAYARAAVPEYVIIDPATRTLLHHRLAQPGSYAAPRSYSAADTVRFDCLPTLAVPVGQLFSGAPDETL